MQPGATFRALAIVGAAACSSGGPSGPIAVGPVTEVSISPVLAQIELPGQSRQLSATARDANGATVPDAEWTWSSSNTGVVTIDADGNALAVGVGRADVTATAEGVSGSREVSVSGPQSLSFLDGDWTVTRSDGAVATTRFGQLTGGIREEVRTRDGAEILRTLTRIDSDGVTWLYGRADAERRRMQYFQGALTPGESQGFAVTPDGTGRIVLEQVSTTGFTLRIQAMVAGAWTDEITETYER